MSEQDWRVTRAQPGLYVFLLDQSYSMSDPIGGSNLPKCEVLADAINQFIVSLITQCEKGEARPRHFFDVSVVGYTTDENGTPIVGSAFQGKLANTDMLGLDIVSIVDLAENQVGTKVVGGSSIPYWYEPMAQGGSPMCTGLDYCRRVAEMWASEHQECVPPIVIHITDGESTDGDPEAFAHALKSVQTRKGNALLFNVHLSDSRENGILFPNDEAHLPDDYARLLFRMSSLLPDFCVKMAQEVGWSVLPYARGMAFNSDGNALTTLLNVGTLIPGKRPGLR